MQKPNYKKALTHPIFSVIRKASKELDIESFVIGGFVRDFILKRGVIIIIRPYGPKHKGNQRALKFKSCK